MEAFSASLDRYERIMKRYLLAKESKSENSRNAIGQVQRDIRELGHSLSLFSEAIAKRKRSNIRDTMSSLNRLQLIQCLVFAAGLLGFGAFVFRKIIHPLEVLEKQTALIAEGQYELLEHSPQEAEIRDVFQSLNRMLERLKRREDELVQSRKLASLGTLLAGVAHELNNPLSNIRSSAEILLEDGDELDRDLIQANLEGIVEQVDRGHIIVLDLLELGRTREFSREELNLGQLVQSVLSLLHGEIGHHTVVHQSIDRGVTVYADKRRMQEVLMNLISNAVEACDYQGDITIEASMDKDSTVILSVKDNGRGIERDTVNRIFDPFFTTKDVGKGTGLGLFLTHEILVRHGGRIWVESTPGQGSSFFVRLPGRRRE
jgi:signal transduction histidine kinase